MAYDDNKQSRYRKRWWNLFRIGWVIFNLNLFNLKLFNLKLFNSNLFNLKLFNLKLLINIFQITENNNRENI